MEDNKNLNPEVQNKEKTIKSPNKVGVKKNRKSKKIKNQLMLKRGSFSLAITAIVLVGLILLNVLVGVLADRFVLEFDMTSDRINTISAENLEYIKGIDEKIEVIVCANRDDYIGDYMAYYAQQYDVNDDATNYYTQTVNLVDKYADYNNNISIRYVDTQDTEFTKITTEYTNVTINYGDIIVSCGTGKDKRHKIIGYEDIYNLTADESLAQYGYTTNTVTGNNIETALTSAISYVTNGEVKKIAILTGHSNYDYSANYVDLLKTNNFEVTEIEDTLINTISSDFDAVVIAGPTVDFIGSEIQVISDFLENNGNLNKGLVFIADASAPYLTNLYDFLTEWGIAVEDGILYETDSGNHIPDDPTTFVSYASSADKITNGMAGCITGYNVGLTALFEQQDSIEVTSLMNTQDTVVNAPVGAGSDWDDADQYEKKVFSTAMQAVKQTYNDENDLCKSYVYAFGSLEYIFSDYCEMQSTSNKAITLSAAERSVGADENAIKFVTKTISQTSFADAVTSQSSSTIFTIFVVILPILCIAASIFIYIRRKNS